MLLYQLIQYLAIITKETENNFSFLFVPLFRSSPRSPKRERGGRQSPPAYRTVGDIWLCRDTLPQLQSDGTYSWPQLDWNQESRTAGYVIIMHHKIKMLQ